MRKVRTKSWEFKKLKPVSKRKKKELHKLSIKCNDDSEGKWDSWIEVKIHGRKN